MCINKNMPGECTEMIREREEQEVQRSVYTAEFSRFGRIRRLSKGKDI